MQEAKKECKIDEKCPLYKTEQCRGPNNCIIYEHELKLQGMALQIQELRRPFKRGV